VEDRTVDLDRRNFLKVGGAMAAGTAVAVGLPLTGPSQAALPLDQKTEASPKNLWGMVIDLNRCVDGCTDCVDACRTENNVPEFGDESIDCHWIRKAEIQGHFPNAAARSLPLLCNHCDDAPCVHVCPVGASFRRKDGIVLVDAHICIGCRYCMIACPYNARAFVFKKHEPVASNPDVPVRDKGIPGSCTFCVHRLDRLERTDPACVEACAKRDRAMVFGDLNDPESEVAKLVASGKTRAIRSDLGLNNKVHYIGL
jgi:molybdopterin-containing oxidoreductase family iron-sulfur binding subunit